MAFGRRGWLCRERGHIQQTGAESGGVEDSYSDASAKYGPLKLPQLEPVDLGRIYRSPGLDRREPEYLDYNIKGRELYERAPYNAGACYLMGILGGGALGVREGFQKAPNRRARVLMNSIMNAAGKRGSIYGNTFAVLAAYYTCFDSLYDRFGVDQAAVVRQAGVGEYINPTLAGASAGLLYKSMAGPRVALMASAAGVGVVGVGFAIDKLTSALVGREFIFQ